VGQDRLGPSYIFIPLVLGPLNSLVWYVPSFRYTRGLGWRMHCGVEVTESSTNKQHHLSKVIYPKGAFYHTRLFRGPSVCRGRYGLGMVVLLFILGSSLGGVGPERGLRGRGRRGWCE
jgi:hypothetical protein